MLSLLLFTPSNWDTTIEEQVAVQVWAPRLLGFQFLVKLLCRHLMRMRLLPHQDLQRILRHGKTLHSNPGRLDRSLPRLLLPVSAQETHAQPSESSTETCSSLLKLPQ